jgi:nucleoside-diphosphate-sugar epimerase
VVDAIGALSDRETTVGNVYHLCDPTPLPVEQFVETLADAVGHQSVTIPMTKQVALATVSALASASVRIDGATLDYLDHPTRYACPNTQRALTGTGIEVPPFESYVSQIVDFARNNPGIGDEPMV